jgi:hypothetical protein
MKPAAVAVAIAAVVLLWSGRASAQVPTVRHDGGFDVDRLAPPPGPGVFVQVEDGDVADRGAWSATASLSFEVRPLVVRHAGTGEELSVPVETRTGLDLGVAYGVGHDAQLGLSIPVVVYQSGDRLRGLDLPDEGPLQAAALGDLRLSGKLNLVASEGGLGQAWGVAATLRLPTGDETQFAGEAATMVEFHIIGSWRSRRWGLAANVGPRFRSEEVDFLSPEVTLGNEIVYGAAGSVRLPWGPDVDALAEVAGARGDEGVSPVEVRAGIRWRVAHGFTAGVVGGTSISGRDDVGAPVFRAVVDLRWEPRPRLDSDDDGVPDWRDHCPAAAEDEDDFQDDDGCPDEDDDADGVRDGVDACPDRAEDRDRYLDDDGCPEDDNDKDGKPDRVDPCPNDADDRCGAGGPDVPDVLPPPPAPVELPPDE